MTYQLLDGDTVGFAVSGDYDPSTELVIDPDLAWATYLGGSGGDYGYDIALDAAGSAYVTGETTSAGWATAGAYDTTYNGGGDVFVAKFSGLAAPWADPSSYFFSQKDPLWGDDPLGSSGLKIRDFGCAVTSVAMALRSWGVETDPKALNACPYVFMEGLRWDLYRQRLSEGAWRPGQDLVNNQLRRFKTLCQQAGVGPFSIHDLRRSCITNWAQRLPIHVVQQLAGHSDIQTTEIYYISVQAEDLAKARRVQSELIGRVLEDIGTDPLLTHFGSKGNRSSIKRCFPAPKRIGGKS